MAGGGGSRQPPRVGPGGARLSRAETGSPPAMIPSTVEELVRDHAERRRDKTLPPDRRKAWDPKPCRRSSRSARRRSDHDATKRQIDSITRQLTAELRKRAKARKTAV